MTPNHNLTMTQRMLELEIERALEPYRNIVRELAWVLIPKDDQLKIQRLVGRARELVR